MLKDINDTRNMILAKNCKDIETRTSRELQKRVTETQEAESKRDKITPIHTTATLLPDPDLFTLSYLDLIKEKNPHENSN